MCPWVIGLQGHQPREVQAASLRSPKNASLAAFTFLLLLRRTPIV